jgi:capsular exopolysaccharide synthesis family protein
MKANSGIAEADNLKLNVTRIQGVYDRFLGLLQNIDISRNLDQETLAILQPASPAARSRKEQKQKAGTFVLASFFGGMGIVFFFAWRDDRFTSLAEISEKFGGVIVGQVPESPGSRGLAKKSSLQAEDEEQMCAESYCNLRSALLFMPSMAGRAKTVLITSAMPREGKSTIALNLARTLALGGSKVVLVDADLRRGHLHELLGMPCERGLTDVLQHPEDLDKILRPNCMANLSFISRGSTVVRPGDLLVGPASELLLGRLREKFDYVIVDTSPVFASDEVSTLAPRADGTLFVVRRGMSRSGPVAEAMDLLARRQARILGIVINGIDAGSKSNYYYNYSEYYQRLVDDAPKVAG